MRSILRFSIGAAVAAMVLASGVAQARTSFDGAWSVRIVTTRGACDSGGTFGLQIRNGVVSGYGGFSVSGRVSSNGATSVTVSSGDQSASGSGRLFGNSGRGSWRGNGSRGVCSGSWFANRQ